MVKYTEEQLKKKDLIKSYIEPLLMSIYPDLDEVQYEVTGIGLELVHLIYYRDPMLEVVDHCLDTINVTGDSLIAMVSDVVTAVRWR